MKNVMIDVETLGVTPGCAVTSIAACYFDETGIGEQFYQKINLLSCEEAGLKIDPQTLLWWMKQDQAKEEFQGLENAKDIHTVLAGLECFFKTGKEIVWAKSPEFDCEILKAAYNHFHKETPWKYYNCRDMRTATDLFLGENPKNPKKAHNALEDCLFQAGVVSDILASANLVKEAEVKKMFMNMGQGRKYVLSKSRRSPGGK